MDSEQLNQAKEIITDHKNICLIPSPKDWESLTGALALFYTLKELGKNVNLIIGNFPDTLNFLIPSLDFISTPKNFVISIPKSAAEVSQIYYEKGNENLKIHLTVKSGQIDKENVSFYFQESNPDLIVTLGVEDFKKHLQENLDSFGFLLNAPIVNIDNNLNNLKFGKINLIEQKSKSEMVLEIIKSLDEGLVKDSAANCLLAGLAIFYDSFKSKSTCPETFETTAYLMKKNANWQQTVENLSKTAGEPSGPSKVVLT